MDAGEPFTRNCPPVTANLPNIDLANSLRPAPTNPLEVASNKAGEAGTDPSGTGWTGQLLRGDDRVGIRGVESLPRCLDPRHSEHELKEFVA